MSPTYPHGTAVWALIDGYPWWPAHVVRPRELCLGPRDVTPSPRAGEVLVEFFNDGHRFAVLPLPKVRPFIPSLQSPMPAYSGPLAKGLKAAVTEAKKYAKARPYAVAQAIKAAQIAVTEHVPVPHLDVHDANDDDDDDDEKDDADADADPSDADVDSDDADPDVDDGEEEDEDDHNQPTSLSKSRQRPTENLNRRLPPRRKASRPPPTPSSRRVTRRSVTHPPPSPPRYQTNRTAPSTPRRTRSSAPSTPRKRRRTADDRDKEWQASPTHLDDVVDEVSSSAGDPKVAKGTADPDAVAHGGTAEEPREEPGGARGECNEHDENCEHVERDEPELKEAEEGEDGTRREESEEEQNRRELVTDLVTEDMQANGPNKPASDVGATSAKERSGGSGVPCEEMVTEDGDDSDDAEQTMVHRETDTANEGDVYQILSKDQVISLLVAREREIRAYYHQNQVLQRRVKQLESGDLLRRAQDLYERCKPVFDDIHKFLADSVSKGRLDSNRR